MLQLNPNIFIKKSEYMEMYTNFSNILWLDIKPYISETTISQNIPKVTRIALYHFNTMLIPKEMVVQKINLQLLEKFKVTGNLNYKTTQHASLPVLDFTLSVIPDSTISESIFCAFTECWQLAQTISKFSQIQIHENFTPNIPTDILTIYKITDPLFCYAEVKNFSDNIDEHVQHVSLYLFEMHKVKLQQVKLTDRQRYIRDIIMPTCSKYITDSTSKAFESISQEKQILILKQINDRLNDFSQRLL